MFCKAKSHSMATPNEPIRSIIKDPSQFCQYCAVCRLSSRIDTQHRCSMLNRNWGARAPNALVSPNYKLNYSVEFYRTLIISFACINRLMDGYGCVLAFISFDVRCPEWTTQSRHIHVPSHFLIAFKIDSYLRLSRFVRLTATVSTYIVSNLGADCRHRTSYGSKTCGADKSLFQRLRAIETHSTCVLWARECVHMKNNWIASRECQRTAKI